ncbi:hypothetical protein [Pseudomonas fluorescens]|uniref:hypothetical protein n=1 Tax=Pseudomonas fluorescens TaxID=294 RepID=UPI00177F3D44|nr:hypothetical protein [Pseudomonas fluorescens]
MQKMINTTNALPAAGYSDVHAPYPQPHPHIPGASKKAETRCVQGLASHFEIFLLDPGRPAVQPQGNLHDPG